jgi:hypothetical protein
MFASKFGLGGKMDENRDDDPDTEKERQVRREFLKRCGRFAVVTPPAMATLLVVSSVPKEAHASTIGRPGRSWGNWPKWGERGDD